MSHLKEEVIKLNFQIGKRSANHPVMFYTNTGTIFRATLHKELEETKYFLIHKVNKNKSILTLRLLKVCSRRDEFTLVLTNDLLDLDFHCIYGIHYLPKMCLEHFRPRSFVGDICIHAPFAMTKGNNRTVLWKSNMDILRSGYIHIKIKQGKHIPLLLEVYGFNQRRKKHVLVGGSSYQIPIYESPCIQLIRTGEISNIKGMYKIFLTE